MRNITGDGLWKGALAGTVAGLGATLVMTGFQNTWNATQRRIKERMGMPGQSQSGDGENSTVTVARKISQTVLRRDIDEKHRPLSGMVVHYAFGTLMGAAYGVLAEALPATRAGFGTAFGAALFLAADEVALPASGMSPGPRDVPPIMHVYGAASHLVYGAAAEALLRGSRFALDRGIEGMDRVTREHSTRLNARHHRKAA